MAAAGSRRRRGSVGAGHAGGASRVAELGARHAAAADDAELAAFVDGMSVITPLNALGLLSDLKLQRTQYVTAAANAPAFDKGSVADCSNAILA